MHFVQLFGLIVSVALFSEAYAQSERDNEKKATQRKAIVPNPSVPVAKPKPPAPSSTYTAPPINRQQTERYHEPPRPQQHQSTAPKATTSPKTQSVKNTTTPSEARDPALARCDDLRRRMEAIVREEGFGGDPARQQRIAEQKRAIYQEELRYGCI